MFTCQLAICDLCKLKLPHNHSACKCCAEPLTGGIDGMCGKCLKKTPQYNRILSPLLYQPPISTLITRFKYHTDLAAGHVLGQRLVNYLRNQSLQDHSTPCPECIIPVPLHSSRLRQRGFNQSLEVSRLLGKQLSIPVLRDTCIRHRATDSQSGLNEKQRRQNICNAFSADNILPCKHIAIVDDVMTTVTPLMNWQKSYEKRELKPSRYGAFAGQAVGEAKI